MVAAVPSSTAPSTSTTQPVRRPWSPDGDAHLIFQWVKMEGKTQRWVADAFGIDQSTVSRIVQRYERWQAHAKQREGGRLDPAERLRAQRWLTSERNELILASCLRIASEMEGFTDVSRSTVLHPANHPSKELEIRTEHARVDRTGIASRFLRLAFKINMEQLKLAELDPPPLAPPLADDELAEEDRQAAADAAELAAAKVARSGHRREAGHHAERGRAERVAPPVDSPLADDNDLVTSVLPGDAQPPGSSLAEPTEPPASTLNLEPETLNSADHDSPTPPLNPEPRTLNPSLHTVHNLHTENPSEIAPTPTEPCTCTQPCTSEQNSPAPCITDHHEPHWDSGAMPAVAQNSLPIGVPS
jgi:Helix-turn-helix domain